jgi:hypothetical protein
VVVLIPNPSRMMSVRRGIYFLDKCQKYHQR